MSFRYNMCYFLLRNLRIFDTTIQTKKRVSFWYLEEMRIEELSIILVFYLAKKCFMYFVILCYWKWRQPTYTYHCYMYLYIYNHMKEKVSVFIVNELEKFWILLTTLCNTITRFWTLTPPLLPIDHATYTTWKKST